MRVALAAGGSGGHIIPALTVLDALKNRRPDAEAAFFGPDDRGERDLVAGRNLPFHRVPSAGLRGRNPIAMSRGLFHVGRGVTGAGRALRRFRPDVVFSTGGYASFPSCAAAKLLRLPIVIFLPDVEPGWAVRVERRLATRIATSTEAALEHLPKDRTTVTGYPVRASFFSCTRESAREKLGLADDDQMVLVAGASQGALAINHALFEALATLLTRCHVFHITGRIGEPEAEKVREDLEAATQARYHPAPYRDDLPALMLAADLIVCRSGASVLGELPAARLPSILVPGTYAGGHQRDNAHWLSERGAALLLEESELSLLGPFCLELLGDPGRLAAMGQAAEELARPGAAEDIAAIIEEVTQ